jgi:hypothetical protein
MYKVMIKERVRALWVNMDGSLNNKPVERTFVASDRPLTLEEAEEVKLACETCLLTEKNTEKYVNATIYPAGWLSVWIEKIPDKVPETAFQT